MADEFVGTLESALTLWRTLTFQHGRQTEMVAGVEKYRGERKCDVVVYGHTHEPGSIGDYHFNSGCWARQHDTYVAITDNGQASVWEWLGEKAIPYHATLILEQYDAYPLPLDRIYYDADFNCRGQFTLQSVSDLAESIRLRGGGVELKGLDYPIVVQPIAGHDGKEAGRFRLPADCRTSPLPGDGGLPEAGAGCRR